MTLAKITLLLALTAVGCKPTGEIQGISSDYNIMFMDQSGNIKKINSIKKTNQSILLIPTTIFEQKTLSCFVEIDQDRSKFFFEQIFYEAFKLCVSQNYYNKFFDFDKMVEYVDVSNDVTQPNLPANRHIFLRYIATARERSELTIICSYNDIENEHIDMKYDFNLLECLEQRNAQ
jgi:hypothetical protein